MAVFPWLLGVDVTPARSDVMAAEALRRHCDPLCAVSFFGDKGGKFVVRHNNDVTVFDPPRAEAIARAEAWLQALHFMGAHTNVPTIDQSRFTEFHVEYPVQGYSSFGQPNVFTRGTPTFEGQIVIPDATDAQVAAFSQTGLYNRQYIITANDEPVASGQLVDMKVTGVRSTGDRICTVLKLTFRGVMRNDA